MIHTARIPEERIPDKPLGRHIEHDDASWDHAFAGEILSFSQLKSIMHVRAGGPLNQGNIGACTGNATAGAIDTQPLHEAGMVTLKEQGALKIYGLATKLDSIPGTYPPDDTGSTGLSAAKAAHQLGYIGSYSHAFNMMAALSAMMVGPVITGINWYEGFDTPDPNTGLCRIAGEIRGGHEIEEIGFVLMPTLDDCLIIAENSWGTSWGAKIDGVPGRFCYTVETKQTLLSQQGDVTILNKK